MCSRDKDLASDTTCLANVKESNILTQQGVHEHTSQSNIDSCASSGENTSTTFRNESSNNASNSQITILSRNPGTFQYHYCFHRCWAFKSQESRSCHPYTWGLRLLIQKPESKKQTGSKGEQIGISNRHQIFSTCLVIRVFSHISKS